MSSRVLRSSADRNTGMNVPAPNIAVSNGHTIYESACTLHATTGRYCIPLFWPADSRTTETDMLCSRPSARASTEADAFWMETYRVLSFMAGITYTLDTWADVDSTTKSLLRHYSCHLPMAAATCPNGAAIHVLVVEGDADTHWK